MKERIVKTYSVKELGDEAQEHAKEKWLEHGMGLFPND